MDHLNCLKLETFHSELSESFKSSELFKPCEPSEQSWPSRPPVSARLRIASGLLFSTFPQYIHQLNISVYWLFNNATQSLAVGAWPLTSADLVDLCSSHLVPYGFGSLRLRRELPRCSCTNAEDGRCLSFCSIQSGWDTPHIPIQPLQPYSSNENQYQYQKWN